MGMSKSSKADEINKIIELLSMTQDDTGSVLLVKIPTMVSFLDLLPAEIVQNLLSRMPDIQPPIESDDWVGWFKMTCQKFQIPRERFIEKAKIDKADLSKFESNKLKFGADKRRRLLAVIQSEVNILIE